MKITKRQLRRIIREEKERLLDECPSPESNMPCPIETASEMANAGASEAEVLHWIHLLLSEFSGGMAPKAHHEDELEPPGDEFSFTGDVAELPGEEAFGIGYEAGTRGL